MAKMVINVNLADKDGTVANVIITHREEISTYCTGTALDDAKANCLELIRTARDCPSRRKIEMKIMKQTSVDSLHKFMWDLLIAGQDRTNKVIGSRRY